jgi:outer membrane protein TolC
MKTTSILGFGLLVAFAAQLAGCRGVDSPSPLARRASVSPADAGSPTVLSPQVPAEPELAADATTIQLVAVHQPVAESPDLSAVAADASAEDAESAGEPQSSEVAMPDPPGGLSAEASPDLPTGCLAEQVLDLSSALEMAGGQSPQIAFAAARYRESYAQFLAARTLWLPSLRAGISYNRHDGPLQASDGLIVDPHRSSLMTGLGTNAIGAGAPMVPGVMATFHAADALLQPKIAAHAAWGRHAAVTAATNDTLLETALAYLELLRSSQALRIAEQTRDHAEQLAELTNTFAETGQGPQADADRTATELVRRRNDVSRAEEAVAVAGVRLAELLRLDPCVTVIPVEETVVPVDLVCSDFCMAELVAAGLANRPELSEAQALVCEAVQRYRRERLAPLVPSVLLGVSQSGFGGGLGSTIGDFGGRFDLDAAVFWELRNFGLGEMARRDEMAARRDQATAMQVRAMDRVAREVVEAGIQVQSRRNQIAIAETGIQAATDSYDRNLTRIREGQGLPIEVLQSLQALDQARREYLRCVVDYNESQFRLQRAMGWPIE